MGYGRYSKRKTTRGSRRKATKKIPIKPPNKPRRARLPVVNECIEIGPNLFLTRLKIKVKVMSGEPSSQVRAMDLIVVFNPRKLPRTNRQGSLLAITNTGNYKVEMVEEGVGNLSRCLRRILRGEDPPETQNFPALVTPIRSTGIFAGDFRRWYETYFETG